MEKKKPIYLDYAATTPVDKSVLKEMTPYFTEKFGNPNSLHGFGQEAMRALDNSREKAAKAIGADFREIVFTGSATEANNLALRGAAREQRTKDKGQRKPKIIISNIEHESVLETARDLEKQGAEVVCLPVDKNGIVNLKKLEESLNERTVLVSIMYGNNVTGVIQPIAEIANIVRNFRNSKSEARNPKQIQNSNVQNVSNFEFRASNLPMALPLVHTDAVQAFQYLDCDVNNLGIDLMTLSSHKIYGPKGVGLLYRRNPKSEILNPKQIQNPNNQNSKRFEHLNLENSNLFRVSNLEFRISPVITGGGQEFGLRSGTENIPAIVGFAKALEMAKETRKREYKRTKELKVRLWEKLKQALPRIRRSPNEKTPTLPHILNITIPNAPKNLVALLDAKGVAVSSGAACSTRSAKPSYVLTAMGMSEKEAGESIRFSLGKHTTKTEIDEAIRRIKKALE
ncbi:MAG: cysteine desulfurase family protein [bacterium]|nr:cysteine desulfurase family protein [bacterium]